MLKFMSKEERELEIQYYMRHLSDLIPYDDPEHEENIRRMAESVVESIGNDFAETHEYGDEPLDIIDF